MKELLGFGASFGEGLRWNFSAHTASEALMKSLVSNKSMH